MSNQLLGSKLVIVEEDPRVRAIPAIPTAVLAMVGITQRGPVGEARFFTSFKEWVDTYGVATADSLDTWAAVQGYFAEGGSFLWFTRTAHYTDITQAATLTALTAEYTIQTQAATPASLTATVAAPWDFAPNDDISISIDGGGADTATFTATQAQDTAGIAENYVLANGQTLTVVIDGGSTQTVTFVTGDFVAIGAATAAEVAAVVNSALVGASADDNAGSLRISSDTFGTDSSVEVTGGTAAAAFGFGAAVTGTGNVANIDTVTYAEFETVLEAAVTGLTVTETTTGSGIPVLSTTATGAARSIEVTASTNVQTIINVGSGPASGTDGTPTDTLLMQAKDPGAYGNALVVRIGDATSGESDRFNLTVLQSSSVVEVFSNLSMDDADVEGRYIEDVLAASGVGSLFVVATDLDAGVAQRPENGDYTLAGGDDGLTSLADNDFIGSSVSLTGIRSFDNVQGITMLAIPTRATAAVHTAMVAYCETDYPATPGQLLAVLEPPADLNALAMITYIETTAALLNTTEHAAVYWPRIKIQNPNTTVFGQSATITVPNSGHICGRYARTDASQPGGIYRSAAGLENGVFRTVAGLEDDPDGAPRHQVTNAVTRDLVYPKRINPIAPINGALAIDGTRTLRGDSNFPGVGERRAVNFIEASIRSGLQFVRHRNNTRALRKEVERTLEKFLLDQMRLGAFRSNNPDEAFFVDVSDALNPLAVQFANQLNVRVGLATNKTVDFVVISVSQQLGPVEEENF